MVKNTKKTLNLLLASVFTLATANSALAHKPVVESAENHKETVEKTESLTTAEKEEKLLKALKEILKKKTSADSKKTGSDWEELFGKEESNCFTIGTDGPPPEKGLHIQKQTVCPFFSGTK